MGQRFSPALNSFSLGEVGPLTYGRTDLPEYNLSLRLCDNWLPTLQGPLQKRRGTKFVDTTGHTDTASNENKESRLIPYTSADGTPYMLEFNTDGNAGAFIFVWNADGTYTGHSVAQVYQAQHLNEIQYVQNEDLLFLVQKSNLPAVFTYDKTTATISNLSLDKGPLRPENLDQTKTILASGVSGTITITPYTNGTQDTNWGQRPRLWGFRTIPQALHNQWVTGTGYTTGDYVWSNSYESDRVNVYKATSTATSGSRAPGHDFGTESDGVVTWQMVHSEYGFVELNSFTSNPASANVTVVGFPEIPIDFTTATFGQSRWSNGSMGASNGFPVSVAIHEQRLILGGSAAGDQFIHGSKIDQFTNFLPGSLLANSAYQYAIGGSEISHIKFIQSAKTLMIGTANGVYSAFATSGGPITATDVKINRDSNRGCAALQSVQPGEGVLYVQEGNTIMREAIFEENVRGFTSNNISVLAHHLGELGLNILAVTNVPQTIVWTTDNSGKLMGITYDRENNMVAWHQHTLGAASSGTTVVESVSVIPDENGINDIIWIVVKRTIDGNTVRYIEMLDTSIDSWMDSYITYSGVSTAIITGLDHLEGEFVQIIGDGAVQADKEVISGAITVDTAVEEATVGLAYTAKGQTQKIEGGDPTGNSQGKSKRIENVILRLIDTGPGLLIGESEDTTTDLSRVIYREGDDPMDSSVPPFSGDTAIVPFDQNYESGGMIYFEHNLPFNATITAMWPNMEVEPAR